MREYFVKKLKIFRIRIQLIMSVNLKYKTVLTEFRIKIYEIFI